MNDYLKPSKGFHAALENTLDKLPEKAPVRKTHLRPRAAVAMASALAIAVGIGCAASTLIKRQTSWSSAEPDFTAVPTQEQCIKAFGFVPEIVEEFSNGFSYNGGFITHNKLFDDADALAGSYDSLSCEYVRDGQNIELLTLRYYGEDIEGEAVESVDGIELYLDSTLLVLVPDDVEITDEDRKRLGRGDFDFSFGSYAPDGEALEEISSGKSKAVFSYISAGQGAYIACQRSVSWIDNDIYYRLSFIGRYDISSDELIGMAKEMLG